MSRGGQVNIWRVKNKVRSEARAAVMGPYLGEGNVETSKNIYIGLFTAMKGGEGSRWNLWVFWKGSG